jgi:hypothetical protein
MQAGGLCAPAAAHSGASVASLYDAAARELEPAGGATEPVACAGSALARQRARRAAQKHAAREG